MNWFDRMIGRVFGRSRNDAAPTSTSTAMTKAPTSASTMTTSAREVEQKSVAMMEFKSASSITCGGGSAIRVGDPKWAFALDLGEDALPVSLWVYNCASLLAELAGSIRFEAMLNGVPQPDSPLQRLLDKPAPGYRQRDWTMTRAYHLLLAGADYLQITRATIRGASATVKGGLPAELWPYPQGEMTTRMSETLPSRILGYTRVEDDQNLSEANVIRTRFARPNDLSRGLAPLEAAANEAATDRSASTWQAESYGNRLMPDGILMFDQILTQAQLDDADARLKKGLAGARRTFSMGSSMRGRFIALSRNAVEMDFIRSREQSRDFISNSYGVPTDMWSSSATYTNLENSRFILWDQTVIPLVGLLSEGLNDELAPEFGEGWGVRANLDKVVAMIPQIRAKWELAALPLAQGVPMSQVSETFDLGVQPYAGWEIGFISTSLQPVSLWSTQIGGSLPSDDGGDA